MTILFGRNIEKLAVTALVAVLTVLPSTPARAADLNLGQTPLFLGGGVSPNIMFTLDDSGSMAWSYMPDTIAAYYGRPQGLAHTFNTLAFNPAATYSPPVTYDAAGTRQTLPNATFTAAWDDGYAHHTGSGQCPDQVVNLAADYRPTWYYAEYYPGWGQQHNCDDANDTLGGKPEYWGATPGNTALPAGERAFYYTYDPTGTGCSPAGEEYDTCYTEVVLPAEKEQDFANWYSYYRKRTLLAKAGASQAFADIASDSRVGFGRINSEVQWTTQFAGTSQPISVDGASTTTVRLGVRPFSGADRESFFDELFESPARGTTPLREAFQDVGAYFERTGSQSPWDETPGNGSDDENTLNSRCRQSYHVALTDGYWNEGQSGRSFATVGNVDGDDYNNYQVSDPFQDTYSDTLGDVAMQYWATDLQAIDDLVPPNSKDDATWQHLVTYAIGLGLSGLTVTPPEAAFAAIPTKSAPPQPWPDPADDINYPNGKLDDLLHAAVNSRGDFFLANDASSLKEKLTAALKDIRERSGSAASVVLNSAALQSDTALFQARFYSPDWYGSLLAYEIQPNGSLNPTPIWDAGSKIPSDGARSIATFNGTKGVPFTWPATVTADTMTQAQKDAIGSAAILNYLRGDRTGEGTLYRQRQSVLGDIVNSAPVYVAAPFAPYRDVWIEGLDPDNIDKKAPENEADAERYSAFRFDKRERAPRIYVGANDGMLHAFDGKADLTGGGEVFAYVPAAVIGTAASGIKDLASTSYAHRYFVDGSPTAGDAFWNKKWHTVLVGGLGGGGRGIYALDITDPSASNYTGKVLWEFRDTNTAASGNPNGHPDLGYTYSRPNIVRLANDRWAAVFGNGYNNSGSRKAALFVVDLETGRLATSAPLTVTATDPTGAGRPNGLATVAPVDIDGDNTVDYVYAGDLFGNLWKFDLTSAKPGSWGLAGNGAPLFKAVSAGGTAQAITTRPQVVRHPKIANKQPTFLVLFGTGKYLEPTVDNTQLNQATQTFYGIWDDGSNDAGDLTRSELLQQKILGEEVVNGSTFRVTTDVEMRWRESKSQTCDPVNDPDDYGCLGWYLDLINTESNNTNNFGERQVSDSLVRNGRIIFTTLIPSQDPCSFGGDGWLMELDALSGGQPPYPVFDVNGDSVFNAGDYVDIDGANAGQAAAPPSGRKSAVGIVPAPAILSREGGGLEYKYQPGAKAGAIDVVKENPGPGDFGRNSWLQLFK